MHVQFTALLDKLMHYSCTVYSTVRQVNALLMYGIVSEIFPFFVAASSHLSNKTLNWSVIWVSV